MYINFENVKDYILKDYQNFYIILESLGCHHITQKKTEFRFALPNHDNPSSGRLSLNDLSCIVYTPDLEFKGNIVNLIMKIENLDYYQSLCYIIRILGIDKKQVEQIPIKNKCTFGDEIISLYKKYKPIKIEEADIPIIDINKYQYIFKPHYQLLSEGISMFVQKIFHIGYDLRSQRILFPHRYWKGPINKFVGVIGRTTNQYYELLDIPKYLGIESYPKSLNIYGLCENSLITKELILNKFPDIKGNIQTIRDNKYIIIYEAEKSVLKRATCNDFTGVAICGHELSNKQLQILYSLQNVNEIIFALDKDISLEFVMNMAKKIINKQVSIIYDKNNKLGEKDSPADADEIIFQQLLKERIIVNR